MEMSSIGYGARAYITSPQSYEDYPPMTQDIYRRRFIRSAAQWAGIAMVGLGPVRRALAAAPKFINDPFQLGVASGDPVPDGFVIWTRLAPDPYDPKALPDEAIPVAWEVASDDKIKKIVVQAKFDTPNPLSGQNEVQSIPFGAFLAVKLKLKLNTKMVY